MKKAIPILLLTYLLILPLCFLPAYGELKYPAVALLLLLLSFQYPIQYVKADIILFLFLGFLCLSLIDIQNPSYAWLPLSNWLLLLLTAILIRSYFLENQKIVLNLLQAIGFLTIAYTLFIIITLYGSWIPDESGRTIFQMTLENEGSRVWSWWADSPGPNWFRRGYGKNSNVPAVFPVLLTPVILFHTYPKTWINITVKLIVVLALLWIVNYFGSQLGLGLLLIFGLAAIWTIGTLKQMLIGSGILILLILLASPWLIEAWENMSSGLKNADLSGRLAFDLLALKIGFKNWFNGVGIGAWFYEADQFAELGTYALEGNYGSGNTFPTFMAFIHNHNTQMLAEIGLMGFISYLALPILIAIHFLRKKMQKEQIMYALIFLGWYASATTLRFSAGDDNELSEVQWLGWLALGLYLSKEKTASFNLNIIWLTRSLALILVLFFSLNFLANHRQLKAFNSNQIELLASIYIPGVKTTINDVEPIQRHLARWYIQEGCLRDAEEAYRKAIDLLPFDPGLAKEFLQFLSEHNLSNEKDREWAQKVELKYPALSSYTGELTVCYAQQSSIIITQSEKLESNLRARDTIILSIELEEDLEVVSGGTVILKPGFTVKSGNSFSAKVSNCN